MESPSKDIMCSCQLLLLWIIIWHCFLFTRKVCCKHIGKPCLMSFLCYYLFITLMQIMTRAIFRMLDFASYVDGNCCCLYISIEDHGMAWWKIKSMRPLMLLNWLISCCTSNHMLCIAAGDGDIFTHHRLPWKCSIVKRSTQCNIVLDVRYRRMELCNLRCHSFSLS